VTEEDLRESPERIRAEAEGQDEYDDAPDPIVRDRLQRSFAVRGFAAFTNGELDGQDGDEPERDSLGYEPEARKLLHRETFCACARF
jgi:hypothetical protein